MIVKDYWLRDVDLSTYSLAQLKYFKNHEIDLVNRRDPYGNELDISKAEIENAERNIVIISECIKNYDD